MNFLAQWRAFHQARDLRPEAHVPLQEHGDVPWTEHEEKSLHFTELDMNTRMKW